MHTYTMKEQMGVSYQGVIDVTEYLKSLKSVIDVINVEGNRYYQKKDIDLLCIYEMKSIGHLARIEVKTDRYDKTGNIAVETISNMDKMTKGCMMYTEADFIYYYFIKSKKAYIIKTNEFRLYFKNNKHKFHKRYLHTDYGNGSYKSEIYLVPRKILTNILKFKCVRIK